MIFGGKVSNKLYLSILLGLILFFLVTTIVNASAESYHGLTTVGYGNSNVGGSGDNWNSVRFEYTTTPFYFMNQIGASFWSTYNTCNGSINYDSYFGNSAPYYIAQNSRSMHDVMYKVDGVCAEPNAVKKRVSYISHWWQSSGYNGDGYDVYHETALGTSFNDVPTTHWAYNYIENMYQIGIMDIDAIRNQCPASNLFCPGNSVTRAQMAYFLERGMRGSNFQFPQSGNNFFQDVPSNYWDASVIEQLYTDGITSGCTSNPLNFCPETRITRAQMAVLLLRAEHGSSYTPPVIPVGGTTGFNDVPRTYWAAAWIKQLAVEGITSGCTTNPPNYCPETWTSRDQMAVFLQRTFAP